MDDALIVAQTCLKLDPYSPQAKGLVETILNIKKQQNAQLDLQRLENDLRANPTNLSAALTLARFYQQGQQTNRAAEILSNVVQQPQIDLTAVQQIARSLADFGNLPGLEGALEKLVKLVPNEPEAWYDLAAVKAALGKTPEAIAAARRTVELNAQRLARDPKAHDLLPEMRNDGRFNPLRTLPEFQQLIAPK